LAVVGISCVAPFPLFIIEWKWIFFPFLANKKIFATPGNSECVKRWLQDLNLVATFLNHIKHKLC
jgi:hypothetical protein